MADGRPTHSLDALTFDQEAFDDESTFRILDNPEDFLLVGQQGKPDFTKDPLVVSIAAVGGRSVSTETLALEPVKQTMAGFILAHEDLVAPMQNFLAQEGVLAADVSRIELDAVRIILEARIKGKAEVAAAHLLYPDESGTGTASALLVNRVISRTNRVVGTVGSYNQWGSLDLDLVALINQERAGQSTNLGTHYSIEARALGAIGLLADTQSLEKSTRKFTKSRRQTIKDTEPGELRHE